MVQEVHVHHPTFSDWQPWSELCKITKLDQPGVYAIGVSDEDLSNRKFSICPEIRYFGMTISKGGLASRLSQLHGALFDKNGPHGVAWRFRFDYPNAVHSIERFFISVARFDCNPKMKTPGDLRMMGKVLEFEYACFSDYMEVFGHIPKYNDTDLRPKKYYGIGPNLSFNPDPIVRTL
ncbi:hypothetical protein [Holophaga foetida]|uniref:hypothetical protein n=1 Tax=Holophaga foetida TaxID=35839 RepID=UPI0011DCDD02|nr:hypothetical protein [Holophaga foetida]